MTARHPRYGKEEHARRGTDIYERQVCPQARGRQPGKIVAIDVDSGEFDVADTTHVACERLLARCPDAQIWCVRIGYPAVHRFGPRGAGVGGMIQVNSPAFLDSSRFVRWATTARSPPGSGLARLGSRTGSEVFQELADLLRGQARQALLRRQARQAFLRRQRLRPPALLRRQRLQ